MRCAIRRSRGRDAGFVDVVAWGPLGQRCADHLTKGSARHVDGHLQQEEWTDGDGRRHERHRIVADDVQFLGRPDPSDGPILIDGVEF
jgi:single-stranded DNA-binding protein